MFVGKTKLHVDYHIYTIKYAFLGEI